MASFSNALETCLKTILKSCDKSARREFLMLRLTTFNDRINEIHGFKLLTTINESDYDGILNCNGGTALFEATDEAIQVMSAYGSSLIKQEFLANGIIFILTDGDNNSGQIMDAKEIQKSSQKAKKAEVLESLTTVLIGVNTQGNLSTYLKTFKDDGVLDQYEDIGAATPGKLAKLAAFVSQSVSSTSQSLGSGGPSKPISFPI